MRQPYCGLVVVTGLRKWPGLGAAWGNHPQVSQLLSEKAGALGSFSRLPNLGPRWSSRAGHRPGTSDMSLGPSVHGVPLSISPHRLSKPRGSESRRELWPEQRNGPAPDTRRAPSLTKQEHPRGCGPTTMCQQRPTPGRIAPDLQDVPGWSARPESVPSTTAMTASTPCPLPGAKPQS